MSTPTSNAGSKTRRPRRSITEPRVQYDYYILFWDTFAYMREKGINPTGIGAHLDVQSMSLSKYLHRGFTPLKVAKAIWHVWGAPSEGIQRDAALERASATPFRFVSDRLALLASDFDLRFPSNPFHYRRLNGVPRRSTPLYYEHVNRNQRLPSEHQYRPAQTTGVITVTAPLGAYPATPFAMSPGFTESGPTPPISTTPTISMPEATAGPEGTNTPTGFPTAVYPTTSGGAGSGEGGEEVSTASPLGLLTRLARQYRDERDQAREETRQAVARAEAAEAEVTRLTKATTEWQQMVDDLTRTGSTPQATALDTQMLRDLAQLTVPAPLP